MAGVKLALSEALRGAGVGRDEAVLAAVSGGADSMALLHALAAIGQRSGVAHVDHGARADSRLDARFVEAVAAGRGLAFGLARAGGPPQAGESPESHWREERYRLLEALRVRGGYAWVLTAHTLEDQAETLLLRASTGTGLAGLVGIEARSPARRLLRPWLGVSRGDLRAYLRARGHGWREDPSNALPRFTRNRLRQEVLPALERALPGATRKLASLAELAARELGGREREAFELARRSLTPATASPETRCSRDARGTRSGGSGASGDAWWLDPQAFARRAPELRARVWRRVLERAIPAVRVSRVHIERMDAFVATGRGAALSLPGGRTLRRRAGRLWLGPERGARGREPTPRTSGC